jgi:hypothetical protein
LKKRYKKADKNGKNKRIRKGGIAQLVERCPCKADVSGSSPLTSTIFLLGKMGNNSKAEKSK